MPELPEVETIVRGLRTAGLQGLRAGQAALLWERSLAEPGWEEAQARLWDQRLEALERRAKYIVLHFEGEWLLIHLRMSGDLRVDDGTPGLLPHDRFWLKLGGKRLVFNDARKFGRIWLVKDPLSVLGRLGPEPLDPAFTVELFFQRLQKNRRAIKPLLLDQTFLAGLGNIYTDEALHLARLHPLTPAQQLDLAQAVALLAAIRAVLEEGIRRNGASIDWVYRGGSFQNHFRVYQRTGQPCFTCGTPVERITVGQRGTHFCPICQKVVAQIG